MEIRSHPGLLRVTAETGMAASLVSARRLSYTPPQRGSHLKVIVLVFIGLIFTSLGAALYFLIKDKGDSTRTAKALTWRVVFSITLFALLMLAYHFGLVTTRL